MLGEIRIEKQEVNGEWKLVIRSKYAADDSKETRASKLKKDLDFIENRDPNSRIRAVSHTGEVLETRWKMCLLYIADCRFWR